MKGLESLVETGDPADEEVQSQSPSSTDLR